MALPNWPSTFPAPDETDYGLEPDDAVERTQMRSGIARVRQKMTRPPFGVPISWTMTPVQMREFWAWYIYTIKRGASSFFAPVFITGEFETHEVRFVDKPASRYRSVFEWLVTGKLEILDEVVPVSAVPLTAAAVITYTQLGASMAQTIYSAASGKTPTRVQIFLNEQWRGPSSLSLLVGYSTSATPSELVNIPDLRSYASPAIVDVVAGHPVAGAQLGVLQAAARTYVVRIAGTGAGGGRATAALYVT